MSKPPQGAENPQSLVERIRAACIAEAVQAYEQAGISGLCHEGRFEVAISALRMLDLDKLLHSASTPAEPGA